MAQINATDEAIYQVLEKVIPNPKKIPPRINPKLIGLIHKSYEAASALYKNAIESAALATNIPISILISFVEPVL